MTSWLLSCPPIPSEQLSPLRDKVISFKGRPIQKRGILQNGRICYHGKKSFILLEKALFSSPEHKVLKVSCCDQLMSVVRRASSVVVVRRTALTIALKAYSFYTPWQCTRNFVGSIGMICRSKIAKIVPIGNPRWPPWGTSRKSTFRFSSWIKRPIDSKLGRKHQGDL